MASPAARRVLTKLVPILLLSGSVACSRFANAPSLTVAINAGVEGNALEVAAREWGQQRNLHVETVVLPYANLFEKELLDLVSRTGSYDVIMIDDPWFPALAQADNLRDLERLHANQVRSDDHSEFPDPDFINSCLSVCRFPDKHGAYYALPYVGNSQLFFYRKDLFDRYGLKAPATWDDVLTAAKTIATAEHIYGYVMRAAAGNAVTADFMPLLWAFGGDMFDAAGQPALSSPQALRALTFMLQLGKYSPPGYAGFNADEVAAHLLQSTAPMSINWPSWISAMDDPEKSRVAGKIEFCQVPSEVRQGRPALGTWLLAIPTASRHAELAFDFIVWATDPTQMKEAAWRGNPPTRRSIFLDPRLRAHFRSYPVQLASLETARPRPRTPYWNEIENVTGIYLSKANAGGIAPSEALARANSEISGILRRNK